MKEYFITQIIELKTGYCLCPVFLFGIIGGFWNADDADLADFR